MEDAAAAGPDRADGTRTTAARNTATREAAAGRATRAAYGPPTERESTVQSGSSTHRHIHTTRRAESLWVLAVRACGARVSSAEAILTAMEACGELAVDGAEGATFAAGAAGGGLSAAAMLAFLRVCGRARDPHAALLALRKLGGCAPAEAYVSVLVTICTDDSPNMQLATATLDSMEGSGALELASPGQMLRLYIALIGGYSRKADLEAAHAAFEEALEWLTVAQQREAQQRERRADAAQSPPPTAVAPAAARGAREAVSVTAEVGAAAGGGGGEGEPETPWGDRQWLAAERALHRVMVDAAAPHPRGLLLACTLLEQMQRNSGQRLKNGYYSQLISGHATAHELHVALGALTNARRQGVAASGWRVADSTIASLMDAINKRAEASGDGDDDDEVGAAGVSSPGLYRGQVGASETTERARTTAMKQLSDAGLQMDRKVADYLASGLDGGRRGRRARPVNANDDLVTTERGGRPPSNSAWFDAASVRRVTRAGAGGGPQASDDAADDEPLPFGAKQQCACARALLLPSSAQHSGLVCPSCLLARRPRVRLWTALGRYPGIVSLRARRTTWLAAGRLQPPSAAHVAPSRPPHPPLSPPHTADDEFEKLLAQDRERLPSAGDPKPQRDSKRAIDGRRLRNLGKL